MGKFKDLSGMRFNSLTVLCLDESRIYKEKERMKNGEIKQYQIYWLCKCDCGNIITVSSIHLKDNHVKSCGCKSKVDLIGNRFGNLEVIGFDFDRYDNDKIRLVNEEIKSIQKHYICKCDCGNTTSVSHSNLIYGTTKTCGCKINFKDYTGYKFGRWTVIELDKDSVTRKWKCKCGTIKSFDTNYIKNNKSMSCGCYGVEIRTEINKQRIKENEFEEYDTYYKGWNTNHTDFFLISKKDYENVKKYCWSKHDGYWEASSKNGSNKNLKLHQLIMSYINSEYTPSKHQIVDHININPSDNRRENLRIVTTSGNAKNRHRQKNNTSGKVGVSWHNSKNKWIATIGVDGKSKYLGQFDKYDDAVNARLEAEKEYGYCGEW